MNSAVFPAPLNCIQKKAIWVILGLLLVIFVSTIIAYAKWLYLAALLVPLLIYFSLKNPFIFPLGLYAFLLPFDSSLTEIDTQWAKIAKLVGILTILILSLKGGFEKKHLRPGTSIFSWFLLIAYSCSSLLWAIKPSLTITGLTTVGALFILYLVVSTYKVKENEYNTVKFLAMAGGVTAALYIIYTYHTGTMYKNTLRAALTFADSTSNPNRLAYSLLLPAAICLESVMNNRNGWIKAIYGISFASVVYAIILTGSRGAMLATCCILVIFILSTNKKLSFGMIMIIISIVILSLVPEYIFQRWENYSGGAGRTDIWYVGIMSLKKYWLFGAGLSNFPAAYDEYIYMAQTFEGMHRAPHNLYLRVAVELGVIGVLLMFFIMWKHYMEIKTAFMGDEGIMLKAVFWATLMHSMFIDPMSFKSFWLLWMMVVMRRNAMKIKVKEIMRATKKAGTGTAVNTFI